MTWHVTSMAGRLLTVTIFFCSAICVHLMICYRSCNDFDYRTLSLLKSAVVICSSLNRHENGLNEFWTLLEILHFCDLLLYLCFCERLKFCVPKQWNYGKINKPPMQIQVLILYINISFFFLYFSNHLRIFSYKAQLHPKIWAAMM